MSPSPPPRRNPPPPPPPPPHPPPRLPRPRQRRLQRRPLPPLAPPHQRRLPLLQRLPGGSNNDDHGHGHAHHILHLRQRRGREPHRRRPEQRAPESEHRDHDPPAATPAFTAACTGGATQLSSACSCLVSGTQSAGVTVSGETITLTTTAPPQTSTACAPPYYNVQYTGGTFSWPELPGPSGQQWTNPLYPAVTTNQSCCYLCFVIPGCASFLIDTINGGCRLDQLSDSTAATPQDPMCPWGVVADYAPVLEYGYGYGLGPCGFYVESNGDPAD
ncbi:MAG: hypothetical protein FRX48_03182 [Lasallia pustulata]|uniref:Uncharacterized protein n=1 Tax=Lasallia pustulata TaxID=136370 RepID=A0A5M8PVL0_9LECA|nr:MAG: hypothetical protein FRX48_03182 [Lasallia pustulata]